MKKAIAIGLVSVMTAHVAGFYVYFVIRSAEIKQEMRETIKRMPVERLNVLQMSKAQFDRAREDEYELKWQGMMYDIARIEYCESKTIVYALHDEAEDNLISFLDSVLKSASQDKKPVPGSLLSWMTWKYVSPPVIIFRTDAIEEKAFTAYHHFFTDELRTVLVPPPKG